MKVGKFVYLSIRNFFIFFSIITFIPSLPPTTHFKIESFTVTPPRVLEYQPNNYLDNAERFFDGQITGPEHLITNGRDIYATIMNEVVKITGDHIVHIAKFGKPCEPFQMAKCGRPLGIAFDTISNNLIVADAYYGIWSVDPESGDKQQLVSPDTKLDGIISRPAKIFNSVAVAKSGDIYWTDSSSDFSLEDGIQSFMANPSGRLFRYDRTLKSNVFLLDNLYFANGVALSPNEDFVVVAECAGSQLKRFYLKGPKSGTTDIFLDGLPGVPDNITPDSKGLWVPLVFSRSSENPALWQSAARAPLIRKFVLRLLSLLEMPFKSLNDLYPNIYSEMALNSIGSFATFMPFVPSTKTVLRVDWSGKIEYVLEGKDKSVQRITHVMELDNYLYLGSFDQRYLSRVKLPAVIKTGGGSQAKPTTQKPVTTTAKPTTTTVKPTTTTTTAKPTTTTTTPKPTTTTTTTPKPTTTTTPKPTTTAVPLRPAKTPSEKSASSTETDQTAKSGSTTSVPPKASAGKPGDAAKQSQHSAGNNAESAGKHASDSGTAKSTQSTTNAKTGSASTAGSKPETEKPVKPAEPAPIHEDRPADTKQPQPEKLKVIKKGGDQGEF